MNRRRRPLVVVLALAFTVVACGTSTSVSPSSTTDPTSPPVVSPGSSSPGSPSAAPSPPSPSPGPSPSPEPSPSPAVSGARFTVLLIGIDDLSTRRPSGLTDTLIVASLDPVAETASLLAIPRDLTDFPLPDGSTYHGKVNALYTSIRRQPSRFPGAKGVAPEAYLATIVSGLIDVPIDHWAIIDMDGFADLVDSIGGVDVYADSAICDAGYSALGVRGFEIGRGWWHLTGPQALAYARVRHDTGGSDFKRMRRQQDLLVAIRDGIVAAGADRDPLAWIQQVPVVKTDIPPDQLLGAAALAAGIPFESIRSRLIQPFGRGGTEVYDSRGYVLKAVMPEIRDAASRLFTQVGRVPGTGKQDPLPAKPATVRTLPRFNGCG